MLTRMHIDNFRCLVNFDLKLDRLNLLLGENGSGKTTVFEVLRRLQSFLAGEANVDTAFPASDLTRWQQLDLQRFELEMKIGEDVFLYELAVEHDEDRKRRRMKYEVLRMNQKTLFEYKDRKAHLYRDDFTPGPEVVFDWSRSGVVLFSQDPTTCR